MLDDEDELNEEELLLKLKDELEDEDEEKDDDELLKLEEELEEEDEIDDTTYSNAPMSQ